MKIRTRSIDCHRHSRFRESGREREPSRLSRSDRWRIRPLLVAMLLLVVANAAEARNLISFYVEMTPPNVTGANLKNPNFNGCTTTGFVDFPVASPNAEAGVTVYDDAIHALRMIRDPSFWQQSHAFPGTGRLMTGSGSVHGIPAADTGTRLAMHVRTQISGQSGFHFPEFLAASQDGGIRPFLPSPFTDQAATTPPNQTIRLGSLGYDTTRRRAFADVDTVRFDPATRTLTFTYRTGGSAVITIVEASPARTLLRVDLNYLPGASGQMFEVTSMFVSDRTNDVSKIRWVDTSGGRHTDQIMSFANNEVREFTLFRDTYSDHNSLGPDMRVFDFVYDDVIGLPGTVLVDQQSFVSPCAEVDSVVLGVRPQNAPGDTWSVFYAKADSSYAQFAAQGLFNYAAALYHFNRGIGDYNLYQALGLPANANFVYYNGVSLFFYFTFLEYGTPADASYYYYYYQAIAWYSWFTVQGDDASASFYFDLYLGYALGR